MKSTEGFNGLTSEVRFPITVTQPPAENIVLVPTSIVHKARRLRSEGKAKEALELLEKNIWGKIR